MPPAPLLTPALVMGAVRYGETSRIVRLATRDHGVISAIAKGALRPRSPFGAALQLLSEGHAHLIPSRSSDLHTLTAFDLIATHADLGRNLARYHAATALAELTVRFVPAAPNPDLFDEIRADVALLEVAPENAIGVVGLRALWQLVDRLGLGPVVDCCARDGTALPLGDVALSLRDGGFLCAACGRAGATTRLGAADRSDLEALLSPAGNLPLLDSRQEAAHRRLLWRWVGEHLGDTPLPALEAWKEFAAATPA